MNINGWDCIFACDVDEANALLKSAQKSNSWKFTYKDTQASLSGIFDAWSITSGGSGTLLNILAPIQSGTIDAGIEKLDLAGVTPELQVQLGFFDSPDNKQSLKFNMTTPGAKPGDTTPGAVVCINPDTSGKISTSDPLWAYLHDNLPKMFIQNQAAFSVIFASLNLVPPTTSSWLAPKKYAYAYNAPASSKPASIIVFSTTTDRDISTLSRTVDPAMIDPASSFNYLISGALFLQNVVQPALPGAFGNGATSANFVFSNGMIVNSGEISAGSKKVGLINYYPKITSLKITINDDELIVQADGRFDITGLTDAYVTFTTTSHSTLSFDPASQKLSLVVTSKSKDYSKHIPWWERAIAIIGGVVILAIVDVVTEIVSDSVASAVTQSVSDLMGGDLSGISSDVVEWGALSSSVTITHAGLSSNFYMQGK